MNTFLIVGASLLVVSFLLFWLSSQLWRRTGLPPGRVVYADTRAWQECPRPLYASAINLAGKPDYVVQKWQYIIPVEVKSCPAPREPYRSHVLQLAAYCLLVQETYQKRPPFGLIHYPERTFSIPYTKELQDELLDTIEWMRQDWQDRIAERNHDDPLRCRVCGFAEDCDQRLDMP